MMKKLILNISCLFLVAAAVAQTSISSEERKAAINHLKQTQKELLSLVDGLSENQVNFKPVEGAWSIAECVEHLAISEQNLIAMVQMGVKEEADPTKRSEIAMSDEQLLGLITSRDQKVKTRKEFEPTNSFGDFKSTLNTFKNRRNANLKFVKTTKDDLRNHYLQFPFGLIDTYQGILFMSGHTKRHTDQIREILESDNFPS